MAVELVIKIPEESYKATCNGYMLPSDVENVVQGIKNGTPLPKGHGNLIDVNELLISERPKGITDDVWKESHIYKLLSNVQTIVEADKAESGE